MLRNKFELIWLRGLGALKADNKQSYLGMLWWILEPLLLTVLFYLAFSNGMRGDGAGGDGFVFFLLTGLFPFKWTASAITGSANSLLNNKGILGQVYLPKWIFPSIANFTAFIRFSFVFPFILALVFVGGHLPSWEWLDLIYVLLCQTLFNLSLGFLVAAIVPLLPDLVHMIPVAITGLMFTSGIFFEVSARPEHIQQILYLNPFTSILDGYRAILLESHDFTIASLYYPISISGVALMLGAFLLMRFDRYYPRALP